MTRIILFEIQANRRLRLARSVTLQKHERAKQAKPDKTRSERNLSAEDSQDSETQGTGSHKRNEYGTAHIDSASAVVGIRPGSLQGHARASQYHFPTTGTSPLIPPNGKAKS